jgi:chorismate dehydratase
MLLLGSVPYANARPLIEGLASDPAVRLLLETPSRLARRLAEGGLDAALVPSVEVFRDPRLVVVPAGCISSRGPVASVSLFCRRPLGPGGRVLVDESSLTSAALVRVLLEGPLGAPGARLAPCPPSTDPREADADAVLLIGDPALVQDRRGLTEVDLGEAWTRWTGLPFVWAVWAARDAAAAAAAAPVLEEARRRGREALPAIVLREAARLGLPEADLHRYLTRNIRHDLGEEERRGMERFRAEWARTAAPGARRPA